MTTWRRRYNVHCCCLLLALLWALGGTPVFANDAEVKAEQVERELLHAETYYWLGMAEQGGMAAYRKGKQHLQQARKLARQLDQTEASASNYLSRIHGLQTDLEEQIAIAIDTLYGVFPLTRFLDRSIFAESTTLQTYEVIDDPTVMAATFAAKDLALVTIERWGQRHQLDVVFTSVPQNPQLENETLYVFNSHPKFFVHNLREVVDALDDRQLAEFQDARITDEVKNGLLQAFRVNDVLVVNVRQVDVIDGDFFYVLEAKIYGRNQDTPTHDFAVMGFSRNRNDQFVPILWTNAVFLLFAYGAFWLQLKVRKRATVRVSLAVFAIMPLIAFAVGRCAPWFLGPLLKRISPIPETLAIVSFWFPCLAGAGADSHPDGLLLGHFETVGQGVANVQS